MSGGHHASDPVSQFQWLIGETERRLNLNGINPTFLSEGFIAYHLTRGCTPEEVVDIALGTRRRNPDAHLGGCRE